MGKGKGKIFEDEMLERMAKHEAGHLLLGWVCGLMPDTCEINLTDSTTGTWSADREDEYPVIGILTDLGGMIFDGELGRIQELEEYIDTPGHYKTNDDESRIISRMRLFDGDHRHILRGFCKVLLDMADIFLPFHENAVEILLKLRRLDSRQCQRLYSHWDSLCVTHDPNQPRSDFFCRKLAEYIGREVPSDGYIDWDFKPLFMFPDDLLEDMARLTKGVRKNRKGEIAKGEYGKMKGKSTGKTRNGTSIDTSSKVYMLRVTLDDFDDVYADIEARDTTTYERLHDAIFEAFDRWEEHLYMFTLPDGTEVVSPYDEGEDEGKPADKCKLGKTLAVGATIDYLFDFGDCWEHTIEVKSIKDAEANVKYPRIVEVHGDVPQQYPEDDEDYDEDDFDEDEAFEDEAPDGGK